ncbi:hypothetical protein HPB52_010791 [Rhipicephalus sanguineus]|uniref:Uncharacterized protein n=1 Tax=Rhipicephalus sanguineus TaxID=34632 RepID=A0A9D4Q644_RHISA|nr:hypothetical protein HPB52_010791 [Rhipicephalus sanguineus]
MKVTNRSKAHAEALRPASEIRACKIGPMEAAFAVLIHFEECRKSALSSRLSDAELPFAARVACRTRHKCRERADFAKHRVDSRSTYKSRLTLKESNLLLGCTDKFHSSVNFTTTVAGFGVGVRPIRYRSVGGIVHRCRFGKRPTPFPSILVASPELSDIRTALFRAYHGTKILKKRRTTRSRRLRLRSFAGKMGGEERVERAAGPMAASR